MCHQLQALCHGGDVTMFMTLLAAFQILLYRYSGGQEHFAIGSPIANRNRMEIEGLIGFFVTTLVLKMMYQVKISLSNKCCSMVSKRLVWKHFNIKTCHLIN